MAQSAQDSWDNLKQLRPGQKIEVVETSMKSLHGPFIAVSEDALTLEVGKSQESVERAKVVRVTVRDTSHRTRNMLLGAGILGGIALAAAIWLRSRIITPCRRNCAWSLWHPENEKAPRPPSARRKSSNDAPDASIPQTVGGDT